MDRRITLQFEIGISRRSLLAALTLLFMVVDVGDLASESVTLTTYYPAPSGVYTQMITTGQTWLARDGGGVSVGTTSSPAGTTGMVVMNGNVGLGTTQPQNELDVAIGGVALGTYAGHPGPPAYIAPSGGLIASGEVGIGTSNPGTQLDVEGNSGGTGDVAEFIDLNGTGGNAINIGTTKGTWGMLLGNNSGGTLVNNYHGPNWSYVINVQNAPLVLGADNNAVEAITYNSATNTGEVGIGDTNPYGPLDVNGTILSRLTGCNEVHFTDNATMCANGYATTVAGFYGNVVSLGTQDALSGTGGDNNGSEGGSLNGYTALCCPLPPGGHYF